ncbi:helix-hairpin-helix domain-containing protein [Candidatus Xianfuyuplasma coldseepsis]|uniref:Helix-hairpin-helix DNA-binding motif class 1 domain-containing protein n=1 Tax=Candidatus Xianfuyuplasma coldseepsis TaxID=2782163 RepID=A0A7L7KV33_9MOLU|nr:helix-hairpin-helix domain-containing protein [Xianfuyuplasma coldseepsis]QMS85628.1 hypothetical protein G4Z02_07695 [Xianfuyuplasma coldseepsis]
MKVYIQKYGIYAVVFVFVVVVIVSMIRKPEESEEEFTPYIVNNEQEVKKTFIYVDLKGAVMFPGVYKVEHNSRLFQVVERAGGLIANADGNAINLSMILKDQDVIYIPTNDEEYPNILDQTDNNYGGVININTASLEVLQTLSGIGPATAQSIIDYRTENGAFVSIDDILNVSGIGEATFAEIQEFITV